MLHDKLKIVVSRLRGYDTIESREITVDFSGGVDEDLLRDTFTRAEDALLDLRDKMDDEAEQMESQMGLRSPVEVSLITDEG